jgi:Na+/proline symporter
LNYIDQFRLLRGVTLKAQPASLGAQGKTVFDPDFDIDYSGPRLPQGRRSPHSQIASLAVKLGAVVFVLTLPHVYAIELQLLGGIWIIQLLPPVLLGLYARSVMLLRCWSAGRPALA